MANPIEVFGNIKGMTRDFGIDSMPKGYLWDLVDALPTRKGARVEQRGPWDYLGSHDLEAMIYGGYYAAFNDGQKLMVVANSKVWDINISSGVATEADTGPATMVQNGVKLHDKVYFMDGAGASRPRMVEHGSPVTVTLLPASAPQAIVGVAYRNRLVLGGDPAEPQRISFSPILEDGGPNSTWDTAEAWIDTSNPVTGLAAMPSQLLVFHPAAIERVRGTVPPGVDVDDDMYVETLTDQVGCILPHTIIPWRENLIFADERGVFITDGSTVRNLSELGGIGDLWRTIYGNRVLNAPSVSCGTFLDYLMVTVIVDDSPNIVPFTLVCDLNTRSWMRFTNFPATSYIPSESAQEEAYCGHFLNRAMMKVSPMFNDPIPFGSPPPDYVDADATPVRPTISTGFERLSKEEGLKRIRNVHLSYHHESLASPSTADGLKVEYRTDPPTVEEIDPLTGDVAGWIEAGRVPMVTGYTRKKLQIGKAGYGVMIRVSSISTTRTSRLYSIGVESQAQDRGKVTA